MLRESPLPGLDADAVANLAGDWDDGGLWNDVRRLAARFWTAEGSERTLAWHHLVLAVGNFKRQPGRRLRPARLTDQPEIVSVAPDVFTLPGKGVLIGVEDVDSWGRLSENLTGAAVATTTTLLSGLWPGSHFVFDQRVYRAANGLRVAAGLKGTRSVEPAGTRMPKLTFTDYGLVREWVRAVSADPALTVQKVERALYELDSRVERDPGRSWRGYAKAVVRALP